MQVTQLAPLLNEIALEVLGKGDIVLEDLSNVVDIGKEFTAENMVDNYVRALVNRIGKMVFVARPYRGVMPKVLMDAWEYGSVTEKVSMGLLEAQENESWELNDGASYDPNIFYKPNVEVKLFNKRTTFEVPISITRLQVKESFTNAIQLNSFISMIFTAVENTMQHNMELLVMRTINNFIGETIAEGNDVRNVKLLTQYNTLFGTTLTAQNAIYNTDFLKYASMVMGNYIDLLARFSTLFNIGGTDKFTPRDDLHVVLLGSFARATDSYLQADTFHKELTALPLYEKVPYWQGTGTNLALTELSKINLKTASGKTVEQSGIIGIMFDRNALGVNNFDRRTPTNNNAKAEFFNYYYKEDAQYFNDFNENFVVFYLA